MKPGDFGIAKTNGLMGRVIRIGTTSRYNHAFIYVGIVDGHPTIIEANPAGIQIEWLSEYDRSQYEFSDLPLSDDQAKKIITFAYSKVGTPYGWSDLVALVLLTLHIGHQDSRKLLRWKWVEKVATRTDRLVCSQFVAEAYEAAGIAISDKRSWECNPGDLAEGLLRHDLEKP